MSDATGPGSVPAGETATCVVLSYPADLSDHARRRISKEYYRKYLRKVHDTATVGDAWDEFTDVGCCGSQTDVPLRVERVDGGPIVGPETTIAYEERTACGLDRGWAAQNDEPTPTKSDG